LKVKDAKDRMDRIHRKKLVPFSSSLSSDGSRLIWHFKKLGVYDTSSGREIVSFDHDSHFFYHGVKTDSASEWLLVAGLGREKVATTVYDLHRGLLLSKSSWSS